MSGAVHLTSASPDNPVEQFDVKDWLDRQGMSYQRSGHTHVTLKDCPLCHDTRWKVYLNVGGGRKNGFFNTYCCHEAGTLPKLMAAQENMTSSVEAFHEIRRFVEEGGESVIPIVAAPASDAVELRPAAFALPEPRFLCTPATPCIVKGKLGALMDRGITQEIIDAHYLSVTNTGTFYGGLPKRSYDLRLIIPVIFEGQVRTWQGRDLTGRAENRYVFPAGDCSGSLLYDFDRVRTKKTAVLAEGVFAKWALERFVVQNGLADIGVTATFGKKLSVEQERLLIESDVETLIFAWDADAIPQINKIADRLVGRKRILVMSPHSSGLDYDEVPLADLVQCFRSIEPWTRDLAARRAIAYALRGCI